MPESPEKIVQNLRIAQAKLEVFAEQELDIFIKSIRRAQSKIYQRVAELMATETFNPSWSFSNRIRWHTERWAVIEDIAFRESGYTQAVKTYLAAYDRMSEIAKDILEKIPRVERPLAEFTRIPKEWIDFIKRQDYEEFAFLNEKAIHKLHETVLWDMVTGRNRVGLLEDLRGEITGRYRWGKKTGLYEWHAGTYVRTAHHRGVRTWLSEKAKEQDLDWYVYVGPADAKARPFCLEHVGRAYNVQEIEQMDNGQMGNVLAWGGGYNCRHQWIPVDNAFAMRIREDEGWEDKIESALLVA